MDGKEVLEERDIYLYTYTWLIHFIVQLKPTQHCKAIALQLKNKWAIMTTIIAASKMAP